MYRSFQFKVLAELTCAHTSVRERHWIWQRELLCADLLDAASQRMFVPVSWSFRPSLLSKEPGFRHLTARLCILSYSQAAFASESQSPLILEEFPFTNPSPCPLPCYGPSL